MSHKGKFGYLNKSIYLNLVTMLVFPPKYPWQHNAAGGGAKRGQSGLCRVLRLMVFVVVTYCEHKRESTYPSVQVNLSIPRLLIWGWKFQKPLGGRRFNALFSLRDVTCDACLSLFFLRFSVSLHCPYRKWSHKIKKAPQKSFWWMLR